MNVIRYLTEFSTELSNHPLASRNKLAAWNRMIRWQVASRLLRQPALVPFIDDTVLVMEVGMTGATANWYFGLLEFEDMSFAAHFLRGGDLFADVGANVGTYTVLAAHRGSDVVAIEPIHASARWIARNVSINSLSDSVAVLTVAVGGEPCKARMSNDAISPLNHIVGLDEPGIEVDQVTIDSIFGDRTPNLMKMDLEGFEFDALTGAKDLLAKPSLNAVIIELKGDAVRYGHRDGDVDSVLRNAGFSPYRYDPFARTLGSSTKTSVPRNYVYIRNIDEVQSRLRSAVPFFVCGQAI